MKKPFKTVIGGTRFGENYISALLDEDSGFKLSGLLARGSERSRALAADLGVRLFTRAEDLPGDVDVACVVLRSGAFGGPGTAIAETLLRRGIHIIQEHPVHPGEIRQLLAAARHRGVQYQVNSFYGHSQAARDFIRFVSEWRQARMPHYVTMTTAPQLLFSSLDLIGRAFGGLGDFKIGGRAAWPDGMLAGAAHGVAPFEVLHGRIGPVPVIINLQGYLDRQDPDHHALVMHNIAVGGPEGRLELVSSFGPLVWSRAIYVPDYERDEAGTSYLGDWASAAERPHMTIPTALTLGSPDGPSLAEAGRRLFPRIIHGALGELRAAIDGGGDDIPPAQRPEYLTALGSAWQAIMRAVDPLVERDLPPPPSPVPDPRNFARRE
jgi:thiazolinyl reductase component of yersiniabactin synthetase